MSKTSIQTARGPAAPPTGVTTAAKTAPTSVTQPRPVSLGWKVLTVVASLRATVVLFVLALILIFFGTMAQMDEGIHTVLHKIFRCWIAWIPTRTVVRFGQVFFGVDRHIIPSGRVFPFPGGYILGGLLLINVIAAHIVRFRYSWRRSGILLIHVGVALLLVGELVTGLFAIEGRMTLLNGGSSSYTEDYHKVELAFVDPSDPKTDSVVVVPGSMLHEGSQVHDDRLPVDIEVGHFMVNSGLKDNPKPEDIGPVNAGAGRKLAAIEQPAVSGTDSDKVDIPSVYVTFRDKDSTEKPKTYLMSLHLREQTVKVGAKSYEVSLRFQRTYRPYTFKLVKFHHDFYPGTSIPSNFSSQVRILDPDSKEDRAADIYMNNPLRYRGETFYQAGFIPHPTRKDGPDQGTILQVVYNPGDWMPYISCTLVSVGMVVHFLLHLVGFAKRRATS